MSESADKLANARAQATAQYQSICELVTRLRAAEDDEEYENLAPELANAAGYHVAEDNDGWFWSQGDKRDDERHSSSAEAWLACCNDNDLRPDVDDARRAIEEDALSVQVRSGWANPGERLTAEEYEILLCTGGPAVRIVGDLNQYSEPDNNIRLECQDWFTAWTEVAPWVDVGGDGRAALRAYAACFWFGEG